MTPPNHIKDPSVSVRQAADPHTAPSVLVNVWPDSGRDLPVSDQFTVLLTSDNILVDVKRECDKKYVTYGYIDIEVYDVRVDEVIFVSSESDFGFTDSLYTVFWTDYLKQP
jgi:hypothetical protein